MQEDTVNEHDPEDAGSARRARPRAGRAPEAGFTSLYDGAGTGGWTQAGPGSFREVDGTLMAVGGMGLLWYAGRQFADFTLRLDWLATSVDDNSGVFVRFPDPEGDPWVAVHHGYEVQIHDSAPGSQATGAIYRVKAPIATASMPPGEWNAFEITASGRRYTVTLNGVLVNDFTSDDEARGLSGHVGIQNHDDHSPVRFRNIRVKEL
jgi:hypothetical protein